VPSGAVLTAYAGEAQDDEQQDQEQNHDPEHLHPTRRPSRVRLVLCHVCLLCRASFSPGGASLLVYETMRPYKSKV
jgi:hypothetical protein